MNGIVKNYWYSGCWAKELGLLVGVGNSNGSPTTLAISSPDAVNWTARVTPSAIFRDVCWSPEKNLFVAISDGNVFMSSPDGINWTARTAPNSNTWRAVVWAKSLGLFVAISSNPDPNKIAVSSDGITWTGRTPNVGGVWMNLCWSEERGLLVAVANGGDFMTSPDAVNWTARTNPASTLYWTDICWAKELGLFVAVNRGNSGTVRIATSPDGIVWTPRTSAVMSLQGICWAKELGLLIATTGGNDILKSPDGINWTAGTLGGIPSGTGGWNTMIWADTLGLLVAIATTGTGNDQVRISRDAEIWGSSLSDLKISVTGVSVAPVDVNLEPTQTQQLTVTISPVDATNKTVSFFSDNSEVATVNSAGLVTGITEGTATITVTTLDGGFSAACEVTVGNAPPVRRLMYIIKL